MKAVLLAFAFGSIAAAAQDPGMMAAQQAQQAQQQAIQANQQAIEQMQQQTQLSIQQAQQSNQQAIDQLNRQMAQDSTPGFELTRQSAFSPKAGEVAPGTRVRIKCPTHYAIIYYTTNGWTPTEFSPRYMGPIAIDATTEIQAIAIAPNMVRSLVTRVTYTVQGSPAKTIEPLPLRADGVLAAGTPLFLITENEVNSKSAQIGDRIRLLLNQDIVDGDTIVVPKGTPVRATITQADRAGHGGEPGDLAFEVQSLAVNGKVIPLEGGETLEGASHYYKAGAVMAVVPVPGAGLAIRGDEADIKPGMALTAFVTRDTYLQP